LSQGRKESLTKGPRSTFSTQILKKSLTSRSKIILALDLDWRKDTSRLLPDAEYIIKETCKYLCAVKINLHLIVPLSLPELGRLNHTISSYGLTSIADIKLNDIANTNRVATEYLWSAGFSAIIANPFVGFEGAMDAVIPRAHEIGKGVILLAFMSHKGAEEGYGLKLRDGKTIHDLFLTRAKEWSADGIVMGTTRPQKIKNARKILGNSIKIFCPGSGPQGGNPVASLKAGADYLIFGRSIVESEDPASAVKEIFESLKNQQ
jgi:orotidine-5'-phosphate decarboxylase